MFCFVLYDCCFVLFCIILFYAVVLLCIVLCCLLLFRTVLLCTGLCANSEILFHLRTSNNVIIAFLRIYLFPVDLRFKNVRRGCDWPCNLGGVRVRVCWGGGLIATVSS